MRVKAMGIVLMLLLAGSVGSAAGQPPRDIAAVFLALPLPEARADRPVLAWLASRLDTRAERRALLDRATWTSDYENFQESFVDARNGYLAFYFPQEGEDYTRQRVVLTYFVRSDGERLVVMQLQADESDVGWPGTEDYFWTLSPDGLFTPVNGWSYLPVIRYEDFWQDEPLPDGVARDFFLRLHSYLFVWPQEGTTAALEITSPPQRTDRASIRLVDFFERRRNNGIDLVWDRQRGRFTRGQLHPYWDETDHGPH